MNKFKAQSLKRKTHKKWPGRPIIYAGFTLLALSSALTCFAKDISFEITVDRNAVAVNQPFRLSVTFNGTQDMPPLDLPPIDGLQARYSGPSTMMSIVNGRVSSSITHVYNIVAQKAGSYKIGPFRFEYKGDIYNSNAIDLEVAQSQSQVRGQAPQQDQFQGGDLNQRIFLVMQAKKSKAYLNEMIPLAIKLYVNKVGVRDIQYPQFGHEGFSTGQFGEPKQYQEVVGGLYYDVIEFETNVFGLRPGEFRLGPAGMQCNVIVRKRAQGAPQSPFDDFFGANVFEDFFDRYERYPLDLKSPDIPVTILPLPEENKPQGYKGALGSFNMEVSASPSESKVGDPITLRVVITGRGNFNTVDLPDINLGRDFKAYEPQTKQNASEKTFERIIIPLKAGVKEIPAVTFSFFNTETGRYETITKGPFTLTVTKPDKEEEARIVESKQIPAAGITSEQLGRDIVYIKETPGRLKTKGRYLYNSRMFLGLQALPILIYLTIAAVYARRKRLKTDVKYARSLSAPKKAKAGLARAKRFMDKGAVKEFYDAVFDTLQEYLGDRFHLPSKGITMNVIDEYFKTREADPAVLNKLRDIFRECDMVRYASSQLTKADMQNSLKNLEEAIDYFQRKKI